MYTTYASSVKPNIDVFKFGNHWNGQTIRAIQLTKKTRYATVSKQRILFFHRPCERDTHVV